MDASKPSARTVRLFLTEGTSQGIVVAEVGNWNGKAFSAPRGRLIDLLHRPEASRTGVYILLGADPDRADEFLAYVGEADDIAARIRIHLRSETKDFFDRVIFLISSDETLTKGHVRYLESRLIKLVREAGTVALANDTHPDFQRLPEADRADMDTFVETATIVLPILGFDLFRRRIPRVGGAAERPAATAGRNNMAQPIFSFATGGAEAVGRETEEGFIVFAGSTARRTTSETFPAGYAALRSNLVSSGRLTDGPTHTLFQFSQDVLFKSPSAAASVVAARSASGPIEWKIQPAGTSYREWRAARLDNSA